LKSNIIRPITALEQVEKEQQNLFKNADVFNVMIGLENYY